MEHTKTIGTFVSIEGPDFEVVGIVIKFFPCTMNTRPYCDTYCDEREED
jgi:hypothetical protein